MIIETVKNCKVGAKVYSIAIIWYSSRFDYLTCGLKQLGNEDAKMNLAESCGEPLAHDPRIEDRGSMSPTSGWLECLRLLHNVE
jgi:hypothetical protein